MEENGWKYSQFQNNVMLSLEAAQFSFYICILDEN